MRLGTNTEEESSNMENEIQLSHGAGGSMSAKLMEEIVLPALGNPILNGLHDGAQLSLPLQLCQTQMRRVGLHAFVGDQFGPVKTVELRGIPLKKAVADDLLRGIFVFLVVESVHTAKIRYAGFGGYAGAAEKHDVIALGDPALQRRDLLVQGPLPLILSIVIS